MEDIGDDRLGLLLSRLAQAQHARDLCRCLFVTCFSLRGLEALIRCSCWNDVCKAAEEGGAGFADCLFLVVLLVSQLPPLAAHMEKGYE